MNWERHRLVRRVVSDQCLCFFVLAALLPMESPKAEELPSGLVKVRGEGFAPGSGVGARSRAVAAAERDALTVFLESLVGAGGLGSLRSIVEDGAGHIQSSRVLGVERGDGGTRASVEVYLREEDLRDRAASLVFVRLPRKPRVLVLMAEVVAGENVHALARAGVAETNLAKAFRSAGFEVVDSEGLRGEFSPAELLDAVEGREGAAAKLGRATRADVALLGRAVSGAVGVEGGGNLLRIEARVELGVIRVADGTLLARKQAEAAVHGVDASAGARLAIRDATLKLERTAMVAVTLGMLGAVESSEVRLTVDLLPGREDVERVVDLLSAMDGVDGVETTRYARGSVLLRFDYDGKMGALVGHLSRRGEDGFVLEPVEVVEKEMVFRYAGP